MIWLTFLAWPAHADDGWTTYRAATAAADAGAWEGALPLYRQALAEATEPALRQAACFGVGLSTQALAEAGHADAQALACEGEGAFACYLGLGGGEPEAVGRAEAGRSALAARCRPPDAPPRPPPDDTLAWVLVGSGAATLVGGGVLVAMAFSDAAEVRERGRVGTADLEARAELELGLGYGLLGVGAALVAGGIWVFSEGSVAVAPGPGGLAVGGAF